MSYISELSNILSFRGENGILADAHQNEGYEQFSYGIAQYEGDYPYYLRTFTGHLMLTIADRLRYAYLLTICTIYGHDIKITGYGGPDHGYDNIECTRCGMYHHHTYY